MVKDAAIELSKALVKDDDKKELMVEVIEACDALEVSDDQ